MIHAIVDRRFDVRADFIHVRNKDIEGRELLALTRWYADRGARVIVNSRCDIALTASAVGLHLPAGSIAPARWRVIAPEEFLIGVSCHTREELSQAEDEGADYAYLSPVFAPLSKTDDRDPLGLDGFERMIAGITIPILALGGITPERIPACLKAGAAGVAGITLGMRL